MNLEFEIIPFKENDIHLSKLNEVYSRFCDSSIPLRLVERGNSGVNCGDIIEFKKGYQVFVGERETSISIGELKNNEVYTNEIEYLNDYSDNTSSNIAEYAKNWHKIGKAITIDSRYKFLKEEKNVLFYLILSLMELSCGIVVVGEDAGRCSSSGSGLFDLSSFLNVKIDVFE